MRHNLDVARQHAGSSKVWAVVKANAYGHGLENGVRAFAAADGLGLIEVEGAHALRDLGWTRPILLLEGFFEQIDVAPLAEAGIESVIHCQEQIDMLAATTVARPMDVHIKLNTGMNRLGFVPAVCRDVYQRLRAMPQVGRIGFVTHFANSDELHHPGISVAHQREQFFKACEGLDGERSLANSGANLLHHDTLADWVRAGIMLYGGSPGRQAVSSFGLRAAMQLEGALIGVQHLNAGDCVGYGSRFRASKPMRIGIVACGYADGYPRHAPDGTPVCVNGVRTRIVGAVSMDMLTVDLDPVPDAGVGSPVELWGDTLPIDDVARAAGTIGYELMCALARRVPIVVTDD